MHAQSKQALRQEIKQRRRALSNNQQAAAAKNLAINARKFEPLWRAKAVLSYLAFAGEIETHEIHAQLAENSIWLPKITNFDECLMEFFPADQASLTINRYGIAEPDSSASSKAASEFDVILMPLVGFDRCGNRLGMGGGFYDRALAGLEKNRAKSNRQPWLVGLAHHFQEIKSIEAQDWDVPLDAIITDREFIQINHP